MQNVYSYQIKSYPVQANDVVKINHPHLFLYVRLTGNQQLYDPSNLLGVDMGELEGLQSLNGFELLFSQWGNNFDVEKYISVADFREQKSYEIDHTFCEAVVVLIAHERKIQNS